MKYKKNVFSTLEKIEKNKIEKDIINIKNLFLQEKKNIDQLNILINFQTEYLKKMHENMKSGISLHVWNNYKNFIAMLDNTIQENVSFIKNNKITIQNSLKRWSENQIKLKTWINLNKINSKKIFKKKKTQEQIMYENYAQLTCFNKDNYFNVRNSK